MMPMTTARAKEIAENGPGTQTRKGGETDEVADSQ